MSDAIFIDIGSSTIKVYSKSADGALDLTDEKSILFKDGFTQDAGVAAHNIDALLEYLEQWRGRNVRTFATGIWRELPAAQAKSLGENSPVGFNIISHDDEARYLKQAADLPFAGKKAMVINMGGKTTEIVSVLPNFDTKTQLLKIGVADLLNQFPNVNEEISGASIEEMEKFVRDKLDAEQFDTDYDFALFTGELRFEKLSGYPLEPNAQFSEANHPFQVSIDGFIIGTRRIFFDMTMSELRALMPKNPNWMSGARPGAVLPLAIFNRAKIKAIVPSDLNLINGVVKDF
ncbi:MAG: hypothetical protein LBH81_02660 [Rickettsiales bacterium]|jgi:hypothetical protein|nr:hypothetical protein [Rickettsiales bacterium]